MLPAQIYVVHMLFIVSYDNFYLSNHIFSVVQPARFLFVLINMRLNIDFYFFWMNTELLQTCYDLKDFLFSMQHISTLFTYYYYSLKKHTCFFHNLVNLPYNSHKLSAFTEAFCKGFHSSTVKWKPTCLFWTHTHCIWYPSVLEARGWEGAMKEMQSFYT